MSNSGQTMANGRRNGRVKFFNSQKGYGFIIPHLQDGGENIEIFVHHTAIHNDGGFKSLAEGEEVEYDLMQGPKGMQASNVTGPNGASVKGDPNAGRPQPYGSGNFGGGGYGGGSGGPASYLQAYSQAYNAGQQGRQGNQYHSGGQYQGGAPGGGQPASNYSVYDSPGAYGMYNPQSQFGQPQYGGTSQPFTGAGQPSTASYASQAYGGPGGISGFTSGTTPSGSAGGYGQNFYPSATPSQTGTGGAGFGFYPSSGAGGPTGSGNPQHQQH